MEVSVVDLNPAVIVGPAGLVVTDVVPFYPHVRELLPLGPVVPV